MEMTELCLHRSMFQGLHPPLPPTYLHISTLQCTSVSMFYILCSVLCALCSVLCAALCQDLLDSDEALLLCSDVALESARASGYTADSEELNIPVGTGASAVVLLFTYTFELLLYLHPKIVYQNSSSF